MAKILSANRRLCLNPKEGENTQLNQEVLDVITKYLDPDNVLGICEIRLKKDTRKEMASSEDHDDFGLNHNQLLLIHTPHLEDKHKGTRHIVDRLSSNPDIQPMGY